MTHRSTPTNHKNPIDLPLIPTPVHVDKPLQLLQVELKDKLPWLERSFGRAWTSENKSADPRRPVTYPEVWQGHNKDLLNVSPGNDNLSSYSFFRVHDPKEVVEYSQNLYNRIKVVISAIFWIDLKRLDASITYDFGEDLEAEVMRVLTQYSFPDTNTNIRILRVWNTVAKVWETYTIDKSKDQTLVYPRRGMRFEMELIYLEKCN